jgi:ring-1,2-phenylacetyl-CoA epoxidase subunit PaaD
MVGAAQRVDAPVPGSARERAVWQTLARVPDPEIPILSVVDLGIVRFVRWAGEVLQVGITPTYSGCPATEAIRDSIRAALQEAGYGNAVLEEVLAPAWSSDWLTAEGRAKLLEFGIAPPAAPVTNPRRLLRAGGIPAHATDERADVACPRCGSHCTTRISEFGSTPCKAHYRCEACLEPFDYFKCI